MWPTLKVWLVSNSDGNITEQGTSVTLEKKVGAEFGFVEYTVITRPRARCVWLRLFNSVVPRFQYLTSGQEKDKDYDTNKSLCYPVDAHIT